MQQNKITIRHLADLPLGGFAGIVEKQMVMSPLLWPDARNRKDISHGLGDFVYLSTGHFKAHDGAPVHPHENIDIVTLVLGGTVAHSGTLGDGTVIHAPGVQVQRAGSGMQHSEFSPDSNKADFVQMWFLPPEKGLKPDYQNVTIEEEKLITVLGGTDNNCFRNSMTCQVGFIQANDSITSHQPFIAFITEGSAQVNDLTVSEGDLVEGDSINLMAKSRLGLVLIQATAGM